ncbi:MAG: hypothetical protein UX87_C0011G0017 [Candidatus Amesbacteria bacterium GW2011_GWA1_47_16]|uniref:Uncharacterized protein n=1 Tax=Candidatus Amesbacteria bacterium GW2011_GWA1_47_16 TaxID=1618353 RepID=A0A0G1V2K5_9BACT|nr:MAG: hypothetical protein UX87_C0011G0017 [Candidatus Amesbacteria bacterium GW2011_GWA1_47_16]
MFFDDFLLRLIIFSEKTVVRSSKSYLPEFCVTKFKVIQILPEVKLGCAGIIGEYGFWGLNNGEIPQNSHGNNSRTCGFFGYTAASMKIHGDIDSYCADRNNQNPELVESVKNSHGDFFESEWWKIFIECHDEFPILRYF